jgi:hypothetical protein
MDEASGPLRLESLNPRLGAAKQSLMRFNRTKEIPMQRLARATCMLVLVSAAAAPYSPATFAQTPGEPVIYLDQGWSQADREMYYQTSRATWR